jgi:hypothetical protein
MKDRQPTLCWLSRLLGDKSKGLELETSFRVPSGKRVDGYVNERNNRIFIDEEGQTYYCDGVPMFVTVAINQIT